MRHHPARSPLEMDAPGHHPPKKLGEISGVWRRQVQTISSLNNELFHSIESFPIQVTTLCTNSFIFFGSCSNVAPLPHSKNQKIEVSFQKSCFRTWFRVDQKQINAMNLVFHAKLAVPAVPDFLQSALSGPRKVPPPST